jgi:hypothetical protein
VSCVQWDVYCKDCRKFLCIVEDPISYPGATGEIFKFGENPRWRIRCADCLLIHKVEDKFNGDV